jgi:hypothetical protein
VPHLHKSDNNLGRNSFNSISMFFFPINLFSFGSYLQSGLFYYYFWVFFDICFFLNPFTIILFNFFYRYSFPQGNYSFLTFNLLFIFLIL